MINWRIGCSGFHYSEWKTVFYPVGMPQRQWFQFYSQHFSTLELNVTFYRFPRVEYLQTWYNVAPPGFVFSVKVPRLITHYKQFSDTTRLLGDFYGSVREGLKEKLGCVLFQLPSRTAYTPERLQRIIESMDNSFTNVIEFRDVSWWQPVVYKALAQNNIHFCSISHPTLPDKVFGETSLVYYRFHGVPHLYKSQYQKKKLQEIVDQISQKKKIKSAYIYFNNTMGVAGIRNARQIEKMV